MSNRHLKKALLRTGKREIIEFTYWGDEFFGIRHDTLEGANILGKLLMETRDILEKCI